MKRPWLRPLMPLYAAGAALRWSGLKPKRLAWPVISIGNLSAGGTGKTPFTIALAQLLLREGIHVDVLSRGYGRRSNSVERVDPAGSAERFGDEPLLIAQAADVPVYVGAQRWLAGQLAEREAASTAGMHLLGVHLLDDGFQHRQLARDVDIVLVNSEDLDDALLPAGNLREPVSALKRASVLAVAQSDDGAVEKLECLGLGPKLGQPIWRYRREMYLPVFPQQLRSQPVVAFCGIARPEQFFSGLIANGINLAATHAFPDHHRFTAKDVEMLRQMAKSGGSETLMTTAKDFVRLGSLSTVIALPLILIADLRVILENDAEIVAWLKRRLGLTDKASS